MTKLVWADASETNNMTHKDNSSWNDKKADLENKPRKKKEKKENQEDGQSSKVVVEENLNAIYYHKVKRKKNNKEIYLNNCVSEEVKEEKPRKNKKKKKEKIDQEKGELPVENNISSAEKFELGLENKHVLNKQKRKCSFNDWDNGKTNFNCNASTYTEEKERKLKNINKKNKNIEQENDLNNSKRQFELSLEKKQGTSYSESKEKNKKKCDFNDWDSSKTYFNNGTPVSTKKKKLKKKKEKSEQENGKLSYGGDGNGLMTLVIEKNPGIHSYDDPHNSAQTLDSKGEIKKEIKKFNYYNKSKNSHEDKVSAKKGKKKKILPEKKKTNFVIEGGVKYKILKNGFKKQWFGLHYEEDETMTKYQNFFVKCEAVSELEEFKKSLKEKNLDQKQIKCEMFKKERNAHHQLNLDLMQLKVLKQDNQGVSLSKNLRRKLNVHPTSNTSMDLYQTQRNNFSSQRVEAELNYEENDIVAQFCGYWILRENLKQMQAVYDKNKEKLIKQRKDENTSPSLTPDEELIHKNLMKKRLRKERYLLRLKLRHGSETKTRQKLKTKKKPGKLLGITYEENEEVVQYDGFYIKKEGAERLNKLKDQMIAKGCSEEEIWKVLKHERRNEERILKKEKKLFCYICMRVGHMASMCPRNGMESQSKCSSIWQGDDTSRTGRNHHKGFEDTNMNLSEEKDYRKQKPKIIKFDD